VAWAATDNPVYYIEISDINLENEKKTTKNRGLLWEGFRESRRCSKGHLPRVIFHRVYCVYEDNQKIEPCFLKA